MKAGSIESKNFASEVVLSVYTGIALVDDFSRIHECVEHIIGRAVWTHEIPCSELQRTLHRRISDQVPDIDKINSLLSNRAISPDNIDQITGELHAKVGATLILQKGSAV